jgi:5-methylcytosine-specific restriction endonuclease McrA
MKDLQVHHMKPRSQLGGDVIQNLITLCVSCHQRRHRVRHRSHCDSDSLLEDLSNEEIARKLNIAECKFGVRRRTDLILLTFQGRMSATQ